MLSRDHMGNKRQDTSGWQRELALLRYHDYQNSWTHMMKCSWQSDWTACTLADSTSTMFPHLERLNLVGLFAKDVAKIKVGPLWSHYHMEIFSEKLYHWSSKKCLDPELCRSIRTVERITSFLIHLTLIQHRKVIIQLENDAYMLYLDIISQIEGNTCVYSAWLSARKYTRAWALWPGPPRSKSRTIGHRQSLWTLNT
jgi:hypothetical protein